MGIVEKIKTSIASPTQLAQLSGIPVDRIYKWTKGKANPGAEDIILIENIFRKISGLSKDEIKKLVANGGIKEPRISTDANTKTSKKLKTNEKDNINLSPNKNGDIMTIERVMGIAEKLAVAIERDSVTKESLAKTIDWMREKLDEGGALKRKAN